MCLRHTATLMIHTEQLYANSTSGSAFALLAGRSTGSDRTDTPTTLQYHTIPPKPHQLTHTEQVTLIPSQPAQLHKVVMSSVAVTSLGYKIPSRFNKNWL
jgi:hypothetical protein